MSWPSCALSNFAPAPFSIDGLSFRCMEGFLQCLKEPDPEKQKAFQSLTGREAKELGQGIRWQTDGMLHWQGKAFSRYDRRTYHSLLFRAYDAMVQTNPETVRALRATGRCVLWHSIGRFRRSRTCLTVFEFLFLLYRARSRVRRGLLE